MVTFKMDRNKITLFKTIVNFGLVEINQFTELDVKRFIKWMQ